MQDLYVFGDSDNDIEMLKLTKILLQWQTEMTKLNQSQSMKYRVMTKMVC